MVSHPVLSGTAKESEQPMRMNPSLAAFAAALSAASLVGGCSATLNAVGDPFVAPKKFQFLRCQDIAARVVASTAREQDLRTLMDRASSGIGGSTINVFVYQPEYQTVLSDLQQLKETAAEKNCPPPEPPKADANKADAKK
jgi:hypothetical protein